jgi:hypothetical protein
MRIISKFHDYYDSAMAHGSDPTVVFSRETKEGPNELIDLLKLESDMVQGRWSGYGYGSASPWNAREYVGASFVRYFYVIFCGKLYPGVHFYKWDKHRMSPDGGRGDHIETFHYDLAEFKSHASVWFGENFYRYHGDLPEKRLKIIEAHFNRRADGLMDWCITNRNAIYTLYRKSDNYKKEWIIETSPSLMELQFYKVHDAWSAYQELSMWYGGIVPRAGVKMIEISDKVRAEKHGMDKWSFRKKVR